MDRKSTHTDEYLLFDPHHQPGVIRTLNHCSYQRRWPIKRDSISGVPSKHVATQTAFIKNAKIERTRMLKCHHTNIVNAHTCTLEEANNLYKQPRRWNAVDSIGVPTVPTRTTGSRNRRNLSDKRQNVFRFHSAVQIPCRTSMNSKIRIKDKYNKAITWPWYSTIVAITAFFFNKR